MPLIFAKGVSEWTVCLFRLIMCSTLIPRTKSASEIRERWQRQGTDSAHINAICSDLARCINSSKFFSNSTISFSIPSIHNVVCPSAQSPYGQIQSEGGHRFELEREGSQILAFVLIHLSIFLRQVRDNT